MTNPLLPIIEELTKPGRLGDVHARYIGTFVGWNVHPGMTALVRIGPNSPDTILAQFDDFHAQREGVDLAFGWHEFPAKDFEPDNGERQVT